MRKIIFESNMVTHEDVAKAIVKTQFVKLGKKIVICHLTLLNGFEVIGKAGVVDPKNFDLEIGKKIALGKAEDEVWAHLGSLLQNHLAG